jgi:hypothetical protein
MLRAVIPVFRASRSIVSSPPFDDPERRERRLWEADFLSFAVTRLSLRVTM